MRLLAVVLASLLVFVFVPPVDAGFVCYDDGVQERWDDICEHGLCVGTACVVCWTGGDVDVFPCQDPCLPQDAGFGGPIVCYGPGGDVPGALDYCSKQFGIGCWCRDLVAVVVCLPS